MVFRKPMKLQQLRYLCEVERQGLNLSRCRGQAAYVAARHQQANPHAGRRAGRRDLRAQRQARGRQITEPGKIILEVAQRMLRDAENLKRAGQEFSSEDSGSLTIATTHTQARYALPRVVKHFTKRYPKVRLTLHQGSPTQISELVTSAGSRYRHRDRGNRDRSGDAALLRLEPLRDHAARSSLAERQKAHAGGDRQNTPSLPTISPLPAAPRSTRRSRKGGSSPTWY